MYKLSKYTYPFIIIALITMSYWLVYYFLGYYIHIYGNKMDINDLTPWMVKWVKKDGYEIQSMSLLTFIYFILIYNIYKIFDKFYKNSDTKYLIYSFCIFIFSIFSMYLITHNNINNYFYFLFLPFLFNIPFSFFNKKIIFILSILLSTLLFFYTFPSLSDYSYFIGPANKLLHSYDLNTFYFQYNLLTILIFYIMMLFKLSIIQMHFIMLLIFMFWIFILYRYLALIFFKNKIFINYFLISLLIFRALIIDGGPIALPQSSTLRLDLWVICLICVYKFNFSSIFSSLLFCLIYLLDDSFGFLYLILYTLISLLNLKFSKNNFNLKSLYFILPIIFTFIFHFLYFNSIASNSASIYTAYKFGFENISNSSIYWIIMPIMMLCLYLLLLKDISIFFILFIFGTLLIQLIYFYGRSVDNNLYSISGIFIFIIFYTISLYSPLNKYLIKFSILFLCIFCTNKIIIFFSNVYTNINNYNHYVNVSYNLKSIITKYNKSKIFIISDKDAVYNYANDLIQDDKIIPFYANISNVETINNLNNKLKNNNIILIEKNSSSTVYLLDLLEKNNFNLIQETNEFYKLTNK